MKNFLLILFLSVFIFPSCSGGRASLRLSALEYPASMSAYLFGSDGRILVKNQDLKILGKFEYEKRFWGILWSLVRISGDDDIAMAMNEQIKSKGGDGVINLSVTADYCAISSIPILGILPIWPGCTKAKITAEIVKAGG